MVSVGSLVKLNCSTRGTFCDPERGLLEIWLHNKNPGIVLNLRKNIPVPMCDIVFGDQLIYGIPLEDVSLVRDT